MRYLSLLFLVVINFIICKENSFVIVIPSYNNKKFYIQNLNSVVAQTYQQYRIIYIDDCSTDGTGRLVEQFIKHHDQEHRFTLIKNRHRRKHMANHFYAIHSCHDDEIIVHLDGDDWFAHDKVLEALNIIYQDSNIWLTYGQFMHYPAMTLGGCKPYPQSYIDNRDFRYYEHIAGHPRTFRAGLGKNIKLKDFLYHGQLVPCCADVAMMVPMLEMAGGNRIRSIDQVLTYYNMYNPLNIFKTPNYYTSLLHNVESSLRSRDREKYPLLDAYQAPDCSPEPTALLFILPTLTHELRQALQKLDRYGSGYTTIYIIYHKQETSQEIIEPLLKEFPACKFIECASVFASTFDTTLNTIAEKYVFLISGDYCKNLSYRLNFFEHIQQIKKTFALGYFDSITTHQCIKTKMPTIELFDGYTGWQIAYSEELFPATYTIAGALYNRIALENIITKNNYTSPNELALIIARSLEKTDIALGRNQ